MTLDERLADKQATRADRLERIHNSGETGFVGVKFEDRRFALDRWDIEDEFGIVDLPRTATYSEVFLRFLTPDILTDSWNSYSPDHWIYGLGKSRAAICGGQVHLKILYIQIFPVS